MSEALGIQVGGSHYKKMKIQPMEFCAANDLGGLEHTAVKYLSRWQDKGGVEDLRKARHTLDLLIDLSGALIERRVYGTEPAVSGDAYCELNGITGHARNAICFVMEWVETLSVGSLFNALLEANKLLEKEVRG